MPSWVVEKPLKRKLMHLWCKFVILTVFEICHTHIQFNASQKKKSPFSFKTLLRFSKPFSCSKLLLYLIYPESILAKELIGFCFESCRVLKHGSLQISFDPDISFWLVKSCSWFLCPQLASTYPLSSLGNRLAWHKLAWWVATCIVTYSEWLNLLDHRI